jgi:hypothetical protein
VTISSPFSPLKGLSLLIEKDDSGNSDIACNNSNIYSDNRYDDYITNEESHGRAPLYPVTKSDTNSGMSTPIISSTLATNPTNTNTTTTMHSGSNDDRSVCSTSSYQSGVLSTSSHLSNLSHRSNGPPRKRPVVLAYIHHNNHPDSQDASGNTSEIETDF